MLTLCSSNISVNTLRQVSTPSSSKGRWRGKSTNVNRVWSGKAKRREEETISFGNTCTWNQKTGNRELSVHEN